MSTPRYILGISAFYHDSAAALLRDGVIVAAAQEERFTRIKHDERYPKNAIQYCLDHQGITTQDLDAVAFYDKPWIKLERMLETYMAYAPRGFQSWVRALPPWMKEKLWMGEKMRDLLDHEGDFFYTQHHEAHAASAFYPSPFENAAVLTLDGVGEWATATWGTGEGNKLTLHSELQFPHSLGLLYSAMTYYTGFRVNSGEYKVMGLAPYGEPTFRDLILDQVMDLREDGSFMLDMKYFNYAKGLTMTTSAFHELFGADPRTPESEITHRDMNLARSIQEVVEEVVLRMARHVRKETGQSNLCMAGGVALNCVANGKLLREKVFDNIWIQPAAGDAGGALGAALFAWYQVRDKDRTTNGASDAQFGSYLGPAFSSEEVASFLDARSAPSTRPADLPREVAALIADGKTVGWFSGRMEFGPRALGGRSILGDPRNPEAQRTINLKIKYRESFRPFAPSVREEDVAEYFELEEASPYMLLVAPVQSGRRTNQDRTDLFGIERLNVPRSDIPAVTHVDYSARIQTVSKATNPAFHELLTAFKDLTGYGLLVNTSFNVRGEPIVCTPEDAYRCFMRTEMDALVLEDRLLLKADQPVWEEEGDWRDEFALD